MIQPPCKKNGVRCTKRFVGCHDTCKEFIDFKTLKDKELEARHKEQKETDDIFRTRDHKVKKHERRYKL